MNLRDRTQNAISQTAHWLARVVTEPRSELTRWQRAARFAYDLSRYGAKQLRQDNAPQMAGALSFRTLFGLLPVLVVGTIVIRAFSGVDLFRDQMERLLEALGLDEIRIYPAEGASGAEAASQTASTWILELATQAQTVSLAAIGWVGAAVLIYAAISLMVTIEKGFNTIFRAPSGRSWVWRLLVYWTVLTLGPVLLGVTVYVNLRFVAFMETVDTWQWLLSAAPALTGFGITWLMIFFVYWLVPNTHVRVRPALIGALVTALLLEIGRRSLGAILPNMLSVELWRSVGLIPLFMFWVYVMWLVVLFGLEVSATLQMLGGRRLEEIERKSAPTGVVEPAAIVLVMEIVAERFQAGQAVTARTVAEEAEIPEATVAAMFEQLSDAGYLHRVDATGGGGVTLARPAEDITGDDLVRIGFEMVESGGGGRRSELMERLRLAQTTMASQITLGRSASSSPPRTAARPLRNDLSPTGDRQAATPL
jgi:membrane protein